MGLGNYGNGKPRIFCKVDKSVDSKGNDIVKIKSGTKDAPNYFNYADGLLVDIVPFEGEFEGNTTYRVRFVLDDGENDIWLECGRYTGFTRDVLNNLASQDELSHVRITPFLSEDEKTGKKYVRGAVRVGSDYSIKLEKKFKWDDPSVPKIQMAKVGKKDVIDSSVLDEWTDDLIQDVKRRIKVLPATKTSEPAQTETDNDPDF